MKRFLIPVVALLAGALASPAPAWTEGELEVWINGDKAYTGLQAIGDKFAKDTGVKVTVQHPEDAPTKFVQAAQGGKGPDILFWPHDRLGEFADAGLVKAVTPSDDFKAKYNKKAWDAFTHNGQVWGYPVSLEAIGLIYNKKLVDKPAGSLEEAMQLSEKLKADGKQTIMWDYGNVYFTWPFLGGAGGYVFKKTEKGYDVTDVGVTEPGAVAALDVIVQMVNKGVLPKGTTYSVMEAEMNKGNLAMMISGPWAWANLKKSGIDFGVAPLPSVGGKPAQPFVGVLGGMINRSSPNADLATEFLERYVATAEGLKMLNDDVPLGVPALDSFAKELANDPNIEGTVKNVEQGTPMPNVPQMGKFWESMEAALANATDGQASPKDALENAAQRIKQP